MRDAHARLTGGDATAHAPRPTGYVGVTDRGWYDFLRSAPDVDEVNFWRPKDRRRFAALTVGQPFFFKLKKPWNAIVGFAYFARFSTLPLSLVWDAFGQKNGAADFEGMRERIVRLRREPLHPGSDPDIGCILLAEPTFFDEGDWIDQPSDFHSTLTQGKSYDLTKGEGLRIWQECLIRTEPNEAADHVAEPRFGAPFLHRPRLGQGIFRVAVTEAYDYRCAVTGEHSLPVLEAAHIQPYAKKGTHDVSNGLLLRTDIHRLYDRGYVTVTPDRRFLVSPALRRRWDNGKAYYALESVGRIHVPRSVAERPDPKLLEWHRENVFIGE